MRFRKPKDWETYECPIWGYDAAKNPVWTRDEIEVFSFRAGGQFRISGTALATIANHRKESVASYIAEQNSNGVVPEITSKTLGWLDTKPQLNISERFNLFLKVLSDVLEHPGGALDAGIARVSVDQLLAAAIGASPDNEKPQTQSYFEHALSRGLVGFNKNNGSWHMTIPGFEYVEALGLGVSDGDQIFVAMWFQPGLLQGLYYDAIEPAIRDSGYTPLRIDNAEHNEKIDDQIIAEIRKSKAVIVDITCGLSTPIGWSSSARVGSPRGGVFYEAGFAKGLGKPVIWMVDASVAEVENVSHFDIRQYNQIRWTDDYEEVRSRLRNRIEATLGRGNLSVKQQ